MSEPEISTVKKLERNFDDLRSLWRRRKFLCICFILLVIGAPSYLEWKNRSLETELTKKGGELAGVKQERDTADTRLAPFLALADKRFADAQADKRLDLLLDQVGKESDLLSGGTNFPIVLATTPYVQSNVFVFKVQNNCDLPAHNVRVRIHDSLRMAYRFEKKKMSPPPGVLTPVPLDISEKDPIFSTTVDLGTINPHEERELVEIEAFAGIISQLHDQVFIFDITTLNGHGEQVMWWQHFESGWAYTSLLNYHIFREGKGMRLVKSSSRNYPTNATSPIWGNGQ